jgi:ankyrin repeat protein
LPLVPSNFINQKDQKGNTPIHLCNNFEIAKALVSSGAPINSLNDNKYVFDRSKHNQN